MSQTIPISSTSKKRLDEKNGKIVKELSLLIENRNCVECGMRGPTYVDVTTTSFCCATCAGVLRGINPPHRIKSISMATFTCEEVETLKNGGNELNRRTWMGLHSGPQVTNFASKDDRTSFIFNKYEKKKWYVSPEEVAKQRELLDRAVEAKSEQLKMNNTRNDSMDVFSSMSLGGTPSARPPPSVSLDSVFAPPSMLTGVNVDKMMIMDEPHPFSPPAFMAPPPPQPGTVPPSTLPINQQPTHMPTNFAFGSPPSGLMPQSRQPAAVSSSAASVLSPVDPFSPLSAVGKPFPNEPNRGTMAPSSSSTLPPSSNDPFGGDPFGSNGGGGGDPFGPSSFSGFAVKFDDDTPTTSAPPPARAAFDPFSMTHPSQGPAAPHPSQFPPVSIPSLPPPSSDPFASLSSSSLHSATVPQPSVSPVVRSTPPVAAATVPPSHPTPPPSNPPVVPNNDADKYSALAELDELFHSTTISGETSNGKPSWVSTGFSAPPPSSAPAFPTGIGRSSTMGAISSSTAIPSSLTPSSSAFGSQTSSTTSYWGGVPPTGASIPPFQSFPQQPQSASTGMGIPQPPLYTQNNTAPHPQQYAQAAALTGNPFAAFPVTQAPHQSMPATTVQHPNPNWNPFL